jgi:hypothetical protein
MEIVRKTIIIEKPLHCMDYRCVKHSLVLLHVDCNIFVVLSKVLKIQFTRFVHFKRYFRTNHHHLVRSRFCANIILRLYVLLMISSWSFVRPICRQGDNMKLDLKGHNMVSIVTRIQTEWPGTPLIPSKDEILFFGVSRLAHPTPIKGIMEVFSTGVD